MPDIPTVDALDSSLDLVREPYDFVRRRASELDSDVFEARILGRRTICLTGPSAAELFYDESRFQREGASPIRVRKTLFGEGGVQGLDGEAHRHRKRLFLDLTAPERAEELAERFAELWQARATQWAGVERIVLYDEARELLARAALDWAGVPVDEDEVPQRTRQLASLFEHAGSLGPLHWRARLDRWRGDRWAATLVEAVREGHHDPPQGSPLATIARHRDLEGELLPSRVAGVELLNILRPTVAIAVYVTFLAHALHEHPDWEEGLEDEEGERSRWFVDEVRRMYPFFPAIVARVREDFEWQGYTFPEGRRAMLDIDGTNHDPRAWENPHRFRPERFREREAGPYRFIPQGGGEPDQGHRCPGEPVTIAIMETALELLQRTGYEVPDQDLTIDRAQLPALPNSGFVMADVQGPPAGGAPHVSIALPRQDPRTQAGW